MGSGRVVTEHDVLPGAWYLDGDRAPVCISVEAGQGGPVFKFVPGHRSPGERRAGLPPAGRRGGLSPRAAPGRGCDPLRDRHRPFSCARERPGCFFFRFEGYVGSEHLITMRDGCAGFFHRGRGGQFRWYHSDRRRAAGDPRRAPAGLAAAGAHGQGILFGRAGGRPCAAVIWPAVSARLSPVSPLAESPAPARRANAPGPPHPRPGPHGRPLRAGA